MKDFKFHCVLASIIIYQNHIIDQFKKKKKSYHRTKIRYITYIHFLPLLIFKDLFSNEILTRACIPVVSLLTDDYQRSQVRFSIGAVEL